MFNLKNLKQLRAHQNLTQKQMANLLQITERQYRRYESLEVEIPISKLIILANYFQVSIDYLIGRTNDFN
ncbi:XRE family transcriptional regulator [Ruminococcaceae bacterium BL-6]|nr:XRE family transcriptional regulator [Ruminococcaceae bacterium BL-6]